ncbi:MAG: peptide chain release factor 1 [Acidimicrobiaceae bacterium]|nr:peptide chain release factor 1 [Acidimicrobiaceae bacterium]
MAGPDDLVVSRSCVIPAEELSWRFSGSGGPGGQHANTSNTRVELRFDVAGSPSLGPIQRSRLLEHLGPVARVVVSDERSQARNRELARKRLAERIADALRPVPTRRPTRPTRSSKERRLQAKRQQSARKRDRSDRRGDE